MWGYKVTRGDARYECSEIENVLFYFGWPAFNASISIRNGLSNTV